MEDTPLPVRLTTEPLVDVVFEVRFFSAIAASNLLPGLLIRDRPQYNKFERLPAADIPEVVRNQEAALTFSPLMRISAERFSVQVGDKMFSLSCHIPYVGWLGFKEEILSLVNLLLVDMPIDRITRFALRYVNLLELKEPQLQVAAFNWQVTLGQHAVHDQPTLVRMEIRQGQHVHALQVATGATTVSAAGTKHGAIVDIDSYCECSIAPTDFLSSADESLEVLHRENHVIFFSMLTSATLQSLGPKYDE